MAAAWGHVETVKCLIACGSDTTAKNVRWDLGGEKPELGCMSLLLSEKWGGGIVLWRIQAWAGDSESNLGGYGTLCVLHVA